MINVKVELEDLTDDYSIKTISLPCDIRTQIDRDHEYVIISCEPDLDIGDNNDIEKLNRVLDSINNENPEMTAEYLSILLGNSSARDLFDEDFLRRIEENDFMFEDISEIDWLMSPEETAGCYLATELKIPFDEGVTGKMLDLLDSSVLVDYVNWKDVWRQYEAIGFRLVSKDDNTYILHWR